MRPPRSRIRGLPAPPAAARPIRRIRLETPRFLLRTVTPVDAFDGWRDWFDDAELMAPLNLPTRAISMVELRAFIADHDQERRLLIGVFVAQTREQIGAYMIEMDHTHRIATFNLMIGDKSWWGQRVVNETRAALLDFVFDVIGVEKAVGMPVTRNFPAVFNYKAQGWRLEGTLREHARSLHAPGARLDQYVFALSPDQWRALRAAEVRS